MTRRALVLALIALFAVLGTLQLTIVLAIISPLAAPSTVAAFGGEPILSIGKTGPATAQPGAIITYTLTVTNSGPTTAVDLVMVDGLPTGANYVSGGTRYGYLIFWSIPALEGNGASISRQFVVTASQTITNSDYSVAAEGGYEATGDVPVVTVIDNPALIIAKSGPALVRQGEPITYTLVVTNVGTAPATGLLITDAVPSGATYLRGGALNGGEVSWSVPALGAGAHVAVRFAVVAANTIVNAGYGAVADGGVVAPPGNPVTTAVQPWLLHLPLTLTRYTADEPNDVCNESHPLLADVTYRFLAEDAFDWYVYELSNPSPIDLIFSLEDFAPVAGQLLVYRGPACAMLVLAGQNGDFATTKVVRLSGQLAGRYYVLVVNDGPTNLSTPYRLRLTTSP